MSLRKPEPMILDFTIQEQAPVAFHYDRIYDTPMNIDYHKTNIW